MISKCLAAAFVLIAFDAAAQTGGVQLYSVSVYGGYISAALPNGSGFPYGAIPLGSDINLGGSASVGWQRSGPGGNVSLTYNPSYTGQLRYSEWNSLNHSLSFNAGRKLGRKWDLGFSANGSASSMNQFLFSPTTLTRVTDLRLTFDDLAGAMLAGRFSNAQLAGLLTGAPLVESPTRTLIYGNRVLSTAASTSLSYAPSTRLSFHFGGGVSRSQYLNDGQDPESARYRAIVPRTSGANASAGLSYSLTPRTDFGMDVSGSRNFSEFQDAYTTTATLSLGRRMGRRWFLRGHGGGSKIVPLRETYTLPRNVQYVAGGSLGFRTYAHTFLASVDRSMADTYAVGAGSTISAGGAWSWRRPGSSWGLSVSGRQQRMRGTASLNLDGWMVNAGISRGLSRHTAVQLSYAYMENSGTWVGRPQEIAVHAVQFGLVWSPGVGR